MDRVEIYNRYIHKLELNNILSIQNDTLGIESLRRLNVGRYRYSIRRTLDTGVTFATLSIDVYDNEEITDSECTRIVKVEVPTSINDIPVVCIDGIRVIGIKHKVYLDLSDNDLSNIILFNLGFTINNVIGIKFPNVLEKKLRPVSINFYEAKWELSSKNIHSMLKDIDFSDTISMKGLFSCSSIEDFDFNQYNFSKLANASFMFAKCYKLKSVRGSIGTNKLFGYSMFRECTQLDSIGKEVFDGVAIDMIHHMFSGCSKLSELYLCKDNVCMDLNNFAVETFAECNKLDYKCVAEFIQGMVDMGVCFLNAFKGNYRTLKMCELTLYPEQCSYMFESVITEVLDLSKVKLAYTNSEVRGLLDIIFKQSYMPVKSLYDLFNDKDSLDISYDTSDIPKIVVINDSIHVHSLDKSVFSVMDIRGHDDSEVQCTLNRIRTFSGPEKYLVIV